LKQIDLAQELHLVDFVQLHQAAENHFSSPEHLASNPLTGGVNLTRLPNLYEFPGKIGWQEFEALLFFQQRGAK